MKKPLLIAVLVVAGIAVLAALFVSVGFYNVAADEEHSPLVRRLLAIARDRSIAVRAAKIDAPELANPDQVRRGAGNYDSMCAGCHLKPGAEETEISRGLYPKPPELARSMTTDPARAFWVIKHGIKATGMPAWGKSMEDSYIWDMVAFLKQLPQMSAEQYSAEVRASGGHSHGGSETMEQQDESGEAGHSHAEGDEDESGEAEHSHSGDAHSLEGKGDARKLAKPAAKDCGEVICISDHACLKSGTRSAMECGYQARQHTRGDQL